MIVNHAANKKNSTGDKFRFHDIKNVKDKRINDLVSKVHVNRYLREAAGRDLDNSFKALYKDIIVLPLSEPIVLSNPKDLTDFLAESFQIAL